MWWGLRRQETCWRGRRRWSDSSPQLSDSSHIWTNSFENQILLHVSGTTKLCFLLWLWLHLVSHYDRRQDKAKCDSQLGRGCNPHRHTLKVWKWGNVKVKVGISCNCHRHQTFCENLSTTGDIDVSVGNNNVLIISQCLGWWHRDNYQDTNRNINVVKTFMAAMTLPMTLLIVRTNPRKVSPNSRKEQRWQQW